jgi:uncharacterized protein DUF3857/transglutaminase superfamily protein
MRRRLLVFLCFYLPSVCLAVPDQKQAQGWLPVTQQDWAIKEVPYNPGAPAIQLYLRYYKDDNDNFISVYKRIKVLRDAGKKYADIAIEIEPGQSLKQLMARTLHPDGSIVDFQGKPFEKTIIKGRGIKYLARTFTMPDVTVGSIVEYMYTVELPRRLVDPISEWPVQSELFTVKENLRFRPYQGLVIVPTEWGTEAPRSRVAYSYLHQSDPRVPQKKAGNLMELELENVPAFDGEALMPPEADYKPVIVFYYGGRETASPELFWQEWRRLFAEYLDKFVGDYGEIRSLAADLTRNESDSEKKLRKLYARAQQIRNLSFERARTAEELKKEGLKHNTNVREVLEHGYGTSNDIDRLFVALARGAGFDASILHVSERSQRSFSELLLWLGQVDDEAVLVNAGGKDTVLDPGTKYCPYGLLRWKNTSATAFRLSKSGAAFVKTPAPPSPTVRRTARMSLAPDGSAKGEITMEWAGEESLERRIEALDTDEAGRRKSLEDELVAWLPHGGTAKLQSSEGWQETEKPLIARFTVEVPGFAAVTGKRILSPAYFFSPFQQGAFTPLSRRYPIVLPYPFVEQDEFILTLPEGYSVEVAPYRRKAGLSYAGYEIASSQQGNELTVKRVLHLDRMRFETGEYQQLKDFFAIVQAGDGEHAVLQSAAASAAQKEQ